MKAKTNLEKMGFSDPDRKSSKHDEIQVYIFNNIKKIICSVGKNLKEEDVDVFTLKLEHPVISKGYNSKFIVGYLDMYVGFNINDKAYFLAIEIKTKIDFLGDLLRQINTYKEYPDELRNRPTYLVVSEDDRYKDIIESQGIKFYKPKL